MTPVGRSACDPHAAAIDGRRPPATVGANTVQPPAAGLCEEPVSNLRDHAEIPSVFESATVFDVCRSAHGVELVERSVAVPYRKNYDTVEDPLAWPRDFDTTHWTLIAAFLGGRRIGGVIVAATTPGLDVLEDRTDLAVLWDLRVAPEHRRRSVGNSLVRAAEAWARNRGCRELKVETQNTNPAACKFYMRNGFVLSQVRHGAYRELPDEVQLIWRRRL